jgi:hypothetical protein
MADSTDAAARLESKLDSLIATLDEDELAVFHGMVHLASSGAEEDSDVEGFVFRPISVTHGGDPCEGGEIFSRQTISLVGNLNMKLNVQRPGFGRSMF